MTALQVLLNMLLNKYTVHSVQLMISIDGNLVSGNCQLYCRFSQPTLPRFTAIAAMARCSDLNGRYASKVLITVVFNSIIFCSYKPSV